ncbi:FAD-dependent oxidoreductase [Salimicrobium flavidum]|uniref:Pyridine nucleotide-disulphide oxidoreductase n=1 Tax=Salimicrobium flavidum TaxID=570947 RepID=A0A1N7IMQ8_9BACI|nr:FAD-dependent oxidoreductase [Salimicrobium flavidum]SIS38342.1 Pyridine nucleotide-disulphide oxidoreductase [Salimicrobium flavidum]
MFDVAIIGAGPAGASAGIFTAKAGKDVVMFDSGKSITAKAWVENHYGLTKGIEGPELLSEGQKQAIRHGAKLVEHQVSDIEESSDGFIIHSGDDSYEAEHVIFATGMSVKLAEQLGLPVTEGTEPRVAKVIEVNEKGQTAKNKMWAAGTVAGVSVHTIITSGDGARVAVNLLSELNGERYVDHDMLK